jgi:ketosteroid isomerase-like protein
MSAEYLEVVREAFEAFSRDDIEGVLRLCDENIVITQPPELPGASPQQRGHSGVLEAFEIWPEQWDDYRIEILRMADCGDQVLVTTRQGGRGKQSGIQVEMEIMFVFTVRNEKIVEMQIFMREDQALEAAGLKE